MKESAQQCQLADLQLTLTLTHAGTHARPDIHMHTEPFGLQRVGKKEQSIPIHLNLELTMYGI